MSEWPRVKLGEVLRRAEETITPRPDAEYQEITVRLWGKGVTQRSRTLGASISGRRCVAHAGQFIASRIDARNGATGLVPNSLEGALVTNDFPLFNVNVERLDPAFLVWLSRTASFVQLCHQASEGTTNRVRLQEAQFLALEIPLPPLPEQRRIVARIERLAAQIFQVRRLLEEVDTELNATLAATHRRLAATAPRKPLIDVAPLNRRPIAVHVERTYPTVAVRSFGRGTFHKPPLLGSEVTWEKPFLVKTGDILISNIKAWEGALAVARPEDDGRVGSHRYLTCVPIENVATARFVCFHLLTPEGLHEVGEASPGNADRNRTLSTKALMRIQVPVPPYLDQLHFDKLCDEVDAVKQLRAESASELDALLPAILDRAFKGEL